jgi:hypothetical protein
MVTQEPVELADRDQPLTPRRLHYTHVLFDDREPDRGRLVTQLGGRS